MKPVKSESPVGAIFGVLAALLLIGGGAFAYLWFFHFTPEKTVIQAYELMKQGKLAEAADLFTSDSPQIRQAGQSGFGQMAQGMAQGIMQQLNLTYTIKESSRQGKEAKVVAQVSMSFLGQSVTIDDVNILRREGLLWKIDGKRTEEEQRKRLQQQLPQFGGGVGLGALGGMGGMSGGTMGR